MSDLATYIARAIFEAPQGTKHEVKRIQFKGVKSSIDKEELDLGGFCEGALVDCIRTAVDDFALQRPGVSDE